MAILWYMVQLKLKALRLSWSVGSNATATSGARLTGLATWPASNEDILWKQTLIRRLCQFVCNWGQVGNIRSKGVEQDRLVLLAGKKGNSGRQERGQNHQPPSFSPNNPQFLLYIPLNPLRLLCRHRRQQLTPNTPVTVRPNTWWIALSTEFIQGPINSAEMN